MIGVLPLFKIWSTARVAAFTKSSALNDFFGLAISRQWCLIPRISRFVIFAVPMSSQRYTWRESAEIISPFIFMARRTAYSDLPDVVGPTITTIFARALAIARILS